MRRVLVSISETGKGGHCLYATDVISQGLALRSEGAA
jgi:hypothetical protein